jgi:predicted nucleic acid-binding Zn ribbon protein
MGTAYTYRCKKCGYEVETSGKLDCGFYAVTDTYICKSCEEIVDVMVGEHGDTYTREEARKREMESNLDFKFFTCPDCGSEDHLVRWDNSKRPCPKCGGRMHIDKTKGPLLWD